MELELNRYTKASLFSLALIGVSSILLGILAYRATYAVRTRDQKPELLDLVPDKVAQFGGISGIAKVGLYIRNFSVFDMLAGNFTISGIIWFSFDPSIISLDTLQKFSFDKGEIQYLSAPSIRISKGSILARYDIRIKLTPNLNFSLFPFDSHTLYITLDNNFVGPGEVIFQSSDADLVLSPDISVEGWQVADTHVSTGYSSAELEKHAAEEKVYHPRVIFTLDYTQSGIRKSITILLPLLLLFFMAGFSLTMDADKYYATILTLASGCITGLLAYRFVIENLSPKVGYFMISDDLFLLLLSLVFSIFFISTGVFTFTLRHKVAIELTMHALLVTSFAYVLGFF